MENPLDHLPAVQLSPSQKEALTCPTCHKPKEWSANKLAATPAKKGVGFRAMNAKRGPGRPRVRARDKRKVHFY